MAHLSNLSPEPHSMTELARTILACGCVLGHERCFDCRPGLHLDQEKALAMTEQTPARSIVRENLMSRPGYMPYCGAADCRFGMPRAGFNGAQFQCGCGWRSSFEPAFIERYKEKWRAHGEEHKR